jgi:hypothetical protein
MEELLLDIINRGRLVAVRTHYWNLPVEWISQDDGHVWSRKEATGALVNFWQESWPGGMNSSGYVSSAQSVFALARGGQLEFHLALQELFRAVDCRLTELLFLLGMYPGHHWIPETGNVLPFWRKWLLARHILPDGIVQPLLLQEFQDVRNNVEHRFMDIAENDTAKCFEIGMNLIIGTSAMIHAAAQCSCLTYSVGRGHQDLCVQFMRSKGCCYVFVPPWQQESCSTVRLWSDALERQEEPSVIRLFIKKVLSDLREQEPNLTNLNDTLNPPSGSGLGPIKILGGPIDA